MPARPLSACALTGNRTECCRLADRATVGRSAEPCVGGRAPRAQRCACQSSNPLPIAHDTCRVSHCLCAPLWLRVGGAHSGGGSSATAAVATPTAADGDSGHRRAARRRQRRRKSGGDSGARRDGGSDRPWPTANERRHLRPCASPDAWGASGTRSGRGTACLVACGDRCAARA
jgi:hypothetical protein